MSWTLKESSDPLVLSGFNRNRTLSNIANVYVPSCLRSIDNSRCLFKYSVVSSHWAPLREKYNETLESSSGMPESRRPAQTAVGETSHIVASS